MEIRKATIADAPALAVMRKYQLIDEGISEGQDSNRAFTEYFERAIADESLISWLAIIDGEIVATSGLYVQQLPPTFSNITGKIGFITNMYTVKAHRRKGIASSLLDLVINEARESGCMVARLHASEDGKSLYKKYGFKDAPNYMNYWLMGE